MTQNMMRFNFPLCSRMRSFLELQDGLRCLEFARQHHQPLAWVQAAADVRASLVGSVGNRQALSELQGLLSVIRHHLNNLAMENEQFRKEILSACEMITADEAVVRTGFPELLQFLEHDALLQSWMNAVQKQDWLGHKYGFPRMISTFWNSLGMQDRLREELQDLYAIVTHVDGMLNDFVPWSERCAVDGMDQISPPRNKEHGLLIVGLDLSYVQRGITPDFSGNKLAIRGRFHQWQAGKSLELVQEDIPYSMMLVPIA